MPIHPPPVVPAKSLAPISTLERLEWSWKTFGALTPHELYAMLAARSAVFVLEQQCFYSDMDGLDAVAWHLFGLDASLPDRPLAACARVFPPAEGEPAVRIGRVLTAPAYRGLGLGRALMDQAMMRLVERWAQAPIRLNAQAHLQDFYAGFGFVAVSEPHLEDDILHLWMQRAAADVLPYPGAATGPRR